MGGRRSGDVSARLPGPASFAEDGFGFWTAGYCFMDRDGISMWLQPPLSPHYQNVFGYGATAKIVLDRGKRLVIRSPTGQKRLFQQRDGGFASVGSCGEPHAAFSGSRVPSIHRPTAQRPTKRQDSCIIPV